jgi:hypothetical protein
MKKAVGISVNTVSRYEIGTMTIPKYMDLVLKALKARKLKSFNPQLKIIKDRKAAILRLSRFICLFLV